MFDLIFLKIVTKTKFIPFFKKVKMKRKSAKKIQFFFRSTTVLLFWKIKKIFSKFNFNFYLKRLFFEVKDGYL